MARRRTLRREDIEKALGAARSQGFEVAEIRVTEAGEIRLLARQAANDAGLRDDRASGPNDFDGLAW